MRDVWTPEREKMWISCLSRPMEAINRRKKLVAKREFNNPIHTHTVKVVKGDEMVSHLP